MHYFSMPEDRGDATYYTCSCGFTAVMIGTHSDETILREFQRIGLEHCKQAAEMEKDWSPIFDQLNSRFASDIFQTYLKGQHRTLQQAFMRGVIMPALRYFASLKESEYDLRNEASVMLARRMIDAADSESSSLPLV